MTVIRDSQSIRYILGTEIFFEISLSEQRLNEWIKLDQVTVTDLNDLELKMGTHSEKHRFSIATLKEGTETLTLSTDKSQEPTYQVGF